MMAVKDARTDLVELPGRCGLTGEFLKRTLTTYGHMKDRFGARLLPFELQEYRIWLLAKFGGEDNKIRCPYCQRVYVTVFTCVIDHADPAGRGGSLGLENLIPCCKHCNDVKGALSAKTFTSLMRHLETIDPFDAQEIIRRLAMSYKMAKANGIRKRREEAKWAR